MNKVKFMQVMNNLVQNAIDAMPEENGRLTVKSWCNAHWAGIEVSDNGAGGRLGKHSLDFPARFYDQIRGSWHRAALLHNAIREAGGRIRVASEGPGHGATFIIELPLLGVIDLDAEERDDRKVA